MDARQAFKFGFVARCVESGLTSPDEIRTAVIKAAADKAAGGGILSLLGLEAAGESIKGIAGLGSKALGKAIDWAAPIAIAGPPLLGAGGGYLAGKATDVSDYDVDEAKKHEVADEYRRQAQRLRSEGGLRRFTPSSFPRAAL